MDDLLFFIAAAPSSAPSAAPSVALLPLVDLSNDPTNVTAFPLGECEGECDNDGECMVSIRFTTYVK